MIPLRDANPTRRFPVVTYAIIALNVVIFGYLLTLDREHATQVVNTYGLVPVTIPGSGVPYAASRALTSLFLHAAYIRYFWMLIGLGIAVSAQPGTPALVAFLSRALRETAERLRAGEARA